MKIVTIVGARPQFVKAATVSREIAGRADVQEVIVHTGQHFDENMSDVFFDEMEIPKPDYNLAINSLSHGAMTGRMLEKIEKVLIKERPDWLLVYGDTNSTLAGALAAKKIHVKVAHVEAGLRSFNMQMPEEVNRILTDRISDILFCPTEAALKNLRSEGYDNLDNLVVNSGDVMLDAAIYYAGKSREPAVNLPDDFILATIHRAENTDDVNRLSEIISGFNRISNKTPVVLPLHPRTRIYINKFGLKTNFITIDPVGYLEMVYLLQNCSGVITDSGGLQKEAYFFQKQCITIRDETEWVELIDANVNRLCPAESNRIVETAGECWDLAFDDQSSLYGDGNAAAKVVGYMKNSKHAATQD